VWIAALLGRLRPRGEFGRGVLTIASGTGIAQVIVIASAPILTRLYAPADYGIFAVATSIASILIAVTCLRYEFAVLLPEDDGAAANVVALSILVSAVVSLATLIVLALAGASVPALIGVAALGPFVVLISLGEFGGGAGGALVNWAVRTKDYTEIAAFRLAQSVALVGVQIALGVAGLGAMGLLTGDVTGRIAGSGRLARAAWRSNEAAFRGISRAGILAVARRYWRFPVLSSPSALLNALGLQVPLIAVVALFGAAPGGSYALADRACSIPLALIAAAVGQVYLAEAAQVARERPDALRGLFLRTTRSLAKMSIGPAILLAVLAPLFAGLVFGASWSETGLFVAILAPMYFMIFVTTATGNTLYVLERLDLQLLREAVRLVLLGGAVPLAAALGMSAAWAMVLLSVAGCLTYVLYGVISWYAIVAERGDGRKGSHPRVDIVAVGLAATEAGGDDGPLIP
jgi:O-antigen/teichoic acid export membrane protein